MSNVVHTSEFKPEMLANETDAFYMSYEDALEDRKLFVKNLGILLSQTRERILSCELDDHEIVHVSFKTRDGQPPHIIDVNVNMDSYCAIIKDVMDAIKL